MIAMSPAGTIGNDAELKYTANGDAILSFSVACRTGYDKQKGESLTTWVRCTMFGKRAETMAPMLTKGSKVTVTGTGGLRTYTTKDGREGTSLELNVSEVALQGGKPAADPFD